jgi:Tol biopolymer transport system component
MKRLLLAILMGTTLLCAGQGTSPAERQLQSAINKEVVQGDLKGAIEQYKKIVSTYKDNRAVAAKALVHMGACYEKLGESEAERTFRQVVDNYSDQAEAVNAAKNRLAVLSRTRTASPSDVNNLVLRQVSVPEGQISPDGKFIAFDDDPIAVYEILTGKKTALYDPKSCTDCSNEYLAWAPDGNRLAFIRINFVLHSDELCVADKDGANFEIILKKASGRGSGLYLAGWTADGKGVFLRINQKDTPTILAKVAIPESTVQTIKTFDNEVYPEEIRISPDFRYFAYQHFPRGSKRPASFVNEMDISLLSTDGTLNSEIVKHPANNRLLGWSADARYILFSSNRTGMEAVWAQLLKEGKPEGEPRLIKTFSGHLNSLGQTMNGSLYVSERTGGNDVYAAQVDLQTGKILRAPERVEPLLQGSTINPFWSPDGESLGYFVKTTGAGIGSQFRRLRIHSMKTGTNRDYELDLPPRTLGQVPNLTPDGGHIILTTIVGGFRTSSLNLSTGKLEVLCDPKPEQLCGAWSQDGTILYWTKPNGARSLAESQYAIIRRDQKTGQDKQLFTGLTGQNVGNAHLSADGRWLGFDLTQNSEMAFYVIPSDGGTARKLQISNAPNAATFSGAMFFWGPGGKGVVFELFDNARKTSSLIYRPSFDSEETIAIPLEMPRINQLSFHPDGKTIAFNTIEPTETKVWVLENFLPAKK